MFNKTYLLSTQGQADYRAWIKKLTDIAAKECGVSASVNDKGDPVLILVRDSTSVPESVKDEKTNLYVIKITIEIKDILYRELEEMNTAISALNIPESELGEIYGGIEESIIHFLKDKFTEREELLRKAEREQNFKVYDFTKEDDNKNSTSDN